MNNSTIEISLGIQLNHNTRHTYGVEWWFHCAVLDRQRQTIDDIIYWSVLLFFLFDLCFASLTPKLIFDLTSFLFIFFLQIIDSFNEKHREQTSPKLDSNHGRWRYGLLRSGSRQVRKKLLRTMCKYSIKSSHKLFKWIFSSLKQPSLTLEVCLENCLKLIWNALH